jgi:hypothetical protein
MHDSAPSAPSAECNKTALLSTASESRIVFLRNNLSDDASLRRRRASQRRGSAVARRGLGA